LACTIVRVKSPSLPDDDLKSVSLTWGTASPPTLLHRPTVDASAGSPGSQRAKGCLRIAARFPRMAICPESH
jgi:hypothetical protein